MSDKKYHLFLDFDLYKPPLNQMEPHEAYELIRMEVKRLQSMFKLGRAIVQKSGGGYMVKFPFKPLTLEELKAILMEARYVDEGYKYYSLTEYGQTLRISPKIVIVQRGQRKVGRRKEDSTPILWEVIDDE